MKTAETVQEVKKRFSLLGENTFLQETTVDVQKEDVMGVLTFFKKEGGFSVLMDLTAVDYLKPSIQTKIVYWLHNPTNFERVRVVVWISRDEKMPSVTPIWPGANWYERELFDMFGVFFEGHPDQKRILMPDDWVGHPMRRDYALGDEPVEFKHGVQPKPPSEIIPYVKG